MLAEMQWLILIVPAMVWLFKWGMPSRKIFGIRFVILCLLIFALCSPQSKLPGKKGVLVVVADRSSSMPPNAEKSMEEAIGIIAKARPEHAKLGVISFGAKPGMEMTPSKLSFAGFSSSINPGASNLDSAINQAISFVPSDLSGSILVLSDGKWTGTNPRQSAYLATKRGITINFRMLARNNRNDIAITELNTPRQAEPGEAFLITAAINSPKAQKVHLALNAGGKTVVNTERELNKGINRVSLQYVSNIAGVIEFKLFVKSFKNKDSIPGNNIARSLTEIVGRKPVMVISKNIDSKFSTLLNNAGIKTITVSPFSIPWSLEYLLGYSGVVIDDVSANQITSQGLLLIEAWIKHFGGGLFLAGGPNSFGAGGYYQSRLEPALPVSMEMRSESRKMSVAIAVVLDRSGSMSAPTQGGRTKMDLANMAAANTLDMLSETDELTVLAVDTTPHVMVPLQTLENKASIRDNILRIKSQGGGIYVYDGLLAASEILNKAKSKTRHIILFSDACDSEKPGTYWELLPKCLDAGITVSVIGLGTETDPDANILKKIAKAGEGRIFFTNDPVELPRLFAQDTFSVTRSAFIQEQVQIESKPGLNAIIKDTPSFASSVGGYNLAYMRPNAICGAKTLDENKSPIIAAWNYGLGHSACYLAQFEGEASGVFPGSKEASNLFVALANWVRKNKRQEIDNMVVTQKIENGKWKVSLNLDPDREEESFTQKPTINTIQSFPNKEPEKHTLQLTWEDADTLSAYLPITGNETIVSGLSFKQGKFAHLSPICPPYSQEFSPLLSDKGEENLKELAEITGGKDCLELSSVWKDIPQKTQYQDITNWLIYIALFLFLCEIAERRTGFFSILFGKRVIPAPISNKASSATPKPVIKTLQKKNATIPSLKEPEATPNSSNSTTAKKPKSMFSALKKAKSKANRRTKK